MSGSSTILFSNEGARGPTGPPSVVQGITGPTGATGTCIEGETGTGIRAITVEYPTIKIFHGATGITLSCSPITKGATGEFGYNDTYYTLQGTTSSNYSILKSKTPTEYNTNIIDYNIYKDPDVQNDIAEFRGLDFRNITTTDSPTAITITAVNYTSATLGGNTGDLVYITKVGSSYILTGASGNNWTPTIRKLELNVPASREADISGYTFATDNYRYGSVSPTADETGYSYMNISGYTFDNKYVKPVETINSDTVTQSALYLRVNDAGQTASQVIIPFIAQNPIDVVWGRRNYAPQLTTVDLHGSCCLPNSTCVEFATEQYCINLGGTYEQVPCSDRTDECLLNNSCCYYDYISGDILCVNSSEAECEEYMGESSTSRCSRMYCPDEVCNDGPIGRCCVKGFCYTTTQKDCAGTWSSEPCDTA